MKPLLLIIDLQEGWRHNCATEPAMLRAVELCKQYEGDIIHCLFRNDPETLFHKQLHWKRFVDAIDTDVIPEVRPLHLTEYWRTTYSCVTDELLPIFESCGHVYIAGVFTDVSVSATAMDLFDHNIPVSVVTDCVATLHGQTAHESALHTLDFTIGSDHLLTTRELLKL